MHAYECAVALETQFSFTAAHVISLSGTSFEYMASFPIFQDESDTETFDARFVEGAVEIFGGIAGYLREGSSTYSAEMTALTKEDVKFAIQILKMQKTRTDDGVSKTPYALQCSLTLIVGESDPSATMDNCTFNTLTKANFRRIVYPGNCTCGTINHYIVNNTVTSHLFSNQVDTTLFFSP
jgi:hypothetical protein